MQLQQSTTTQPTTTQPTTTQSQPTTTQPTTTQSQARHTICIPRVNNKITKQFIFSIFCNLKLGFIEKVVEIPIKNDTLHKRVLVKIKWNNSHLSTFISNRFDNSQNVKIMYSDPSYWICVPNYTAYSTRIVEPSSYEF